MELTCRNAEFDDAKQRENDVKRPAEARKVLVASTCRKRLLADIPTDAGPRIAGSTGPRQWSIASTAKRRGSGLPLTVRRQCQCPAVGGGGGGRQD